MLHRTTYFISLFFTLILASCSSAPESNPSTALIPMNSALVLRVNDAQELAQFADSTQLPAAAAVPVADLMSMSAGIWTGALCGSGADKMDWIWTTTVGDSSRMSGYTDGAIMALDSTYFALKSGSSAAISTSKMLLQAAMNQMGSGYNILDNAGFEKLWNNANSSDALNLFVQHEELPSVGTWFSGEDWNWTEHLAAWSEIDIDFGKGRVLLTSVSINPDSTNTFFSTFDTSPSGTSVSEIIAASASHAVKMNVGNTVEWLRGYNGYRGKKQRLKQALALLDPLEIEPLTAASWFEGSFVNVGYGQEKVVAAKLTNPDAVSEQLKKLSPGNSLFQGHPSGTLKEGDRFLFSALFGWWYKNLGTPSWMIYEDWLLVAASEQTLEVYANELAAKATWENVKSLRALASGIDKKGHFGVAFTAQSESATKYLKFPEQEGAKEFVIHGNLEVKNDLTFGNARSTEVEKEEIETSTYLWSTALESAATAGPWIVKNHRSGKNDVVVQDENHTVYWIAADGTVSWKKSLEEPIAGALHQVDLFKNNKFQLLFATTTKLHCVDLLGRDVEEYPVTLPEATDVGVSVLDYDRNRNYRFLVAAGAKLYNYSSEGKRIEGWKTDAASERLVTAPELFQKNGKDYIVTSTATKPLILNRRGEERIKTASTAASNGRWAIKNDAIPYAERVGAQGEVQRQSWDGSSATSTDPMGEVRGLSFESYGKVVWSAEEVEVRSENGTQRFKAEGIDNVLTYPGGTGLIMGTSAVQVVNLKTGENYGSFTGSSAVAGRLSPTGMPVLILRQGAAIICYEL